MAEEVQLKVVFLLKRKNWRNWPEPMGKNWKHEYLSFNSWQISEYDIIPSFRGARKMLQDVDVAIIGGWESPMFIRSILLAKKKKIKVIQFYESTGDSHRFRRGPIAQIRKWILSKSHLVISISQSSKKALNKMGIPSEKIAILFNPANVQWFHDSANLHRMTESPGHKFLYVGQLIERKNVANIIRAFYAIRNQADRLTIAGDGPLLEELKNLTISLKMEDSVLFVGHKNQESLAALYAKSHTLILASTNEVWGLVVNEALACGMHVVVSDKCGVAEPVKAMHGVFICRTNQKAIQEAMKESSKHWIGYVQNPEILTFTSEVFATELLHHIL
jgi:glycosyltransferase involved in cell wall biosynthesis